MIVSRKPVEQLISLSSLIQQNIDDVYVFDDVYKYIEMIKLCKLKTWLFDESAKLRALRAYVFTRQCALHAYVPTCQQALRAYV